jgi:hypothetical protein
METLSIEEIRLKYENIEDKIPTIWKSYEEAGRELAQDLFIHWDITEPEIYRVVCLIEMRVLGLRITQHLDRRFAYMGLYPQKIYGENVDTR